MTLRPRRPLTLTARLVAVVVLLVAVTALLIGTATTLAGQSVTVRGVVVADLPGMAGFHLQDVDGDGNAATSDGIFVAGSVDVGLGDTVAVTGTVSEAFGQTQIAAGSNAAICADGTAANLPPAAALDLLRPLVRPSGPAARRARRRPRCLHLPAGVGEGLPAP